MGREEVKEAALYATGSNPSKTGRAPGKVPLRNTYIDTRAEEAAGSELVKKGALDTTIAGGAPALEREAGPMESAGFKRGPVKRKRARAAAQTGLEQVISRVLKGGAESVTVTVKKQIAKGRGKK